MVSCEVKLTVQELYAFLLNRKYRKFTGALLFVFSIICYGVAIFTIGDVDIRSTLLLVLFGALYTIVEPYLLWQNAKKEMKKNPVYQNPLPIQYTFDEKGVSLSQGEKPELVKWEECYKAADYGKLAVVYVNVRGGFIIPKAALNQQYNQFVDLVGAHLPSNLKKRNH